MTSMTFLRTGGALLLAAGLALGASGCIQEKHSGSIAGGTASATTASASSSPSASASSSPTSSATPWTPSASDTPSSSPSSSASTASSSEAGPAACAGGDPGLDSEVSSSVCASNPTDHWSDAKVYRTPVNSAGQNFVSSPTGNITCEMGSTGTACFRKEPVSQVFGVFGSSPGREAPEITDMESSYTKTLDYGEVAVGGDVACASDFVGMTCWNTNTKHGVFVSKQDVRTW